MVNQHDIINFRSILSSVLIRQFSKREIADIFAENGFVTKLNTFKKTIFVQKNLEDLDHQALVRIAHAGRIKLRKMLDHNSLDKRMLAAIAYRDLTKSIEHIYGTEKLEVTSISGNNIHFAIRPEVAVFCALPVEFSALKSEFDIENFGEIKTARSKKIRFGWQSLDQKAGSRLDVAFFLCPMGTTRAASYSERIIGAFPSIKFALVVGICGAVPDIGKPPKHVRLGDITVTNEMGVIEFDAKSSQEPRHLPRPPCSHAIESFRMMEGLNFLDWIETFQPSANIPRPLVDELHESTAPYKIIAHPDDPQRVVGKPRIFSGPIGSSNELLRDAVKRDSLQKDFGLVAVEMEGAGIASSCHDEGVPYYIIRSSVDYCDPFKNDDWHRYSSHCAASFAKLFLAHY